MNVEYNLSPESKASVILELLQTAEISGEFKALFGESSEKIRDWLRHMAEQAEEGGQAHVQERPGNGRGTAGVSSEEIKFLLDGYECIWP